MTIHPSIINIYNIITNSHTSTSRCLLLFCSFCLLSCHARITPQHAVNGITAAPVTSLEVKDSRGNPELLGRWSGDRLQQAPYDSWFVKNYNDYRVDSATADLLKTSLAGKQLRIFMGTWCGDSRREVPRMFRILDYCGIPPSSIQLVMVGYADSAYKQSPGHEEKGLNIFKVPDLIVMDGNRELGRIVESPVHSIEQDLLAISTEKAYTPSYPGVAFLIAAFSKERVRKLEKKLPELAAHIKPLVGSSSDLTVYAHILKQSGEAQKASIALQINDLIFPAGKTPAERPLSQ